MKLNYLLLVFLMTFLSAHSLAQGLNKTISVTSEGTVYGEPDVATLSLGIDAKNIDLDKAVNEANTAINSVKDTLKLLDITEEDIRTSSFNVWPEQNYDRNGNATTENYHVNHSLDVTIRDTEIVGKAIKDSLNAGANSFNSINYSFSDPTKLEKLAREEAMKNAREKAEQLAELAEVKIIGVMSIDEGGSFEQTPIFAQSRFEVMSSVAESSPVSGGQLAINISLSVVFLIE